MKYKKMNCSSTMSLRRREKGWGKNKCKKKKGTCVCTRG